MTIENRLKETISQIEIAAIEAHRQAESVTLIAVSKNFEAETIEVALKAGQKIFGENRVQEAKSKWPELRLKFNQGDPIELHLIGPLQSNKAREAIALFDVIQTVDRQKIAKVLSAEMKKQNKHVPVYVQVNTGEEPQKAGVYPRQVDEFVTFCKQDCGLDVIGLMCIPPANENPGLHFSLLAKIAKRNNLSRLSMGMSSDFQLAVAHGATQVRVGSAIFGSRTISAINNDESPSL